MTCKEGQFDVVEMFRTFSINLNAQYVKGMTPSDLALCTDIKWTTDGPILTIGRCRCHRPKTDGSGRCNGRWFTNNKPRF